MMIGICITAIVLFIILLVILIFRRLKSLLTHSEQTEQSETERMTERFDGRIFGGESAKGKSYFILEVPFGNFSPLKDLIVSAAAQLYETIPDNYKMTFKCDFTADMKMFDYKKFNVEKIIDYFCSGDKSENQFKEIPSGSTLKSELFQKQLKTKFTDFSTISEENVSKLSNSDLSDRFSMIQSIDKNKEIETIEELEVFIRNALKTHPELKTKLIDCDSVGIKPELINEYDLNNRSFRNILEIIDIENSRSSLPIPSGTGTGTVLTEISKLISERFQLSDSELIQSLSEIDSGKLLKVFPDSVKFSEMLNLLESISKDESEVRNINEYLKFFNKVIDSVKYGLTLDRDIIDFGGEYAAILGKKISKNEKETREDGSEEEIMTTINVYLSPDLEHPVLSISGETMNFNVCDPETLKNNKDLLRFYLTDEDFEFLALEYFKDQVENSTDLKTARFATLKVPTDPVKKTEWENCSELVNKFNRLNILDFIFSESFLSSLSETTSEGIEKGFKKVLSNLAVKSKLKLILSSIVYCNKNCINKFKFEKVDSVPAAEAVPDEEPAEGEEGEKPEEAADAEGGEGAKLEGGKPGDDPEPEAAEAEPVPEAAEAEAEGEYVYVVSGINEIIWKFLDGDDIERFQKLEIKKDGKTLILSNEISSTSFLKDLDLCVFLPPWRYSEITKPNSFNFLIECFLSLHRNDLVLDASEEIEKIEKIIFLNNLPKISNVTIDSASTEKGSITEDEVKSFKISGSVESAKIDKDTFRDEFIDETALFLSSHYPISALTKELQSFFSTIFDNSPSDINVVRDMLEKITSFGKISKSSNRFKPSANLISILNRKLEHIEQFVISFTKIGDVPVKIEIDKRPTKNNQLKFFNLTDSSIVKYPNLRNFISGIIKIGNHLIIPTNDPVKNSIIQFENNPILNILLGNLDIPKLNDQFKKIEKNPQQSVVSTYLTKCNNSLNSLLNRFDAGLSDKYVAENDKLMNDYNNILRMTPYKLTKTVRINSIRIPVFPIIFKDADLVKPIDDFKTILRTINVEQIFSDLERLNPKDDLVTEIEKTVKEFNDVKALVSSEDFHRKLAKIDSPSELSERIRLFESYRTDFNDSEKDLYVFSKQTSIRDKIRKLRDQFELVSKYLKTETERYFAREQPVNDEDIEDLMMLDYMEREALALEKAKKQSH